MTTTQIHHLDESVRVSVAAKRVADLERNALRKAASAFEGWVDDGKWVTAQGRRLHAIRIGDATPHTVINFGQDVIDWEADYLVGTDRRDLP